MKQSVTFQCLYLILLFLMVAILPAYSIDVTVGLLAGSNNLGEVEEAAYNWAEDNYQSTILIANDNGTFKTDGGTTKKLDDYAVL